MGTGLAELVVIQAEEMIRKLSSFEQNGSFSSGREEGVPG